VWGCWAVALISLALLLAAAEPVLGGSESTAKIILGLAGVCSLAGTLIGFFGILYADSKQNWLENRLRTERMRLFHFGTILALSNLILAGQKKEFLRRRADLFEAFDRDVLQRPRLALDALVDFDDDGEDGLSVTVPPLKTVSNDTARQLVAAYCRLRVGRQLEFAQYKLRKDGRIFSAFPTQQAHVLGTAAVACILGLVLAHFIVVIDVMFVNEGKLAKWSHAIGFGFGIAAVAFRTLLEGLQSSREVERYRHYRAAMKAAADRMDAESTFEEKLRAAEGIERVSADEMVIFLRASMEARFVM
jgi:hypothetical protein